MIENFTAILSVKEVNMIDIKRQRTVVLFFIVWLGLVSLISCSDNDPGSTGSNGLVSHDGTNMTVKLTAPSTISALAISNLSARVVIDGAKEYYLYVNPNTNAVSGTISGVSTGSHNLEIIYFVMMSNIEVVLCNYSTQVNVVAGESTSVTILDVDLYRNFDNDEDGYTNLAEVRLGTNPLSNLDFPTIGSPLFVAGNGTIQTSSSENYTVKQIVGSAIAGTTSSDSYKIIVSFPGSD